MREKGKKPMKGYVIQTTLFAAACLVALLAASTGAMATEDTVNNEEELIKTLQRADADWQVKQEACRGLRRIGTEKSIPALAALLNDEKLGHLARFALEPMPYPEAGQTLRDALAASAGAQKTGLIISLGYRRDADAVELIASALADADAATAAAAAGALGRIATPAAIKSLTAFRTSAPESLRPALAEGLLAAGQYLMEQGEGAKAAAVFKDVLNSESLEHARRGAFWGLVHADPKKAPAVLVKALAGDDAVFRDVAAQLVAETSGAKQTKRLAAALPALPVEGQAALLRGLGARKDAVARPAILTAMNSGEKAVKVEAIKALGSVGGDLDVATLAPLLVSADADLAAASKESLRNMESAAADTAIAAAVASAEPAVSAQLLEILTAHMAPEAAPTALSSLGNSSEVVRVAALRSLVVLGSPAETPAITTTLAKATTPEELSAAGDALNAIASMYKEEVLPALLEAMGAANPESRKVLLRALGQIAGPKALEPVLAAAKDTDTALRDEALRVLADWRTADAAPHLMELAKTDNAALRDQALRGYVRLAKEAGTVEAKVEMLNTAMGIASSQQEKWLVLAAWGAVPSKQALDTLRTFLGDPAVQNEAASAIIAAATEFGKQGAEQKTQAAEALNGVLAGVQEPAIRDRAQRALEGLK
ncbi:MAG: HEAT repeat domain-containing protein [Candidatus Hydrogenedentes bacterium]|nr:HEAT repeat domain-containing protein [Candidatus Hydrogenedentota bacterium]